MSAPIAESSLPSVPGSPDDIIADADVLDSASELYEITGQEIDSGWQALTTCYTAPESNTLLAATHPVKQKSAEVHTAMSSAASALRTFANDLRGLQTRLATLHSDVRSLNSDVKAFQGNQDAAAPSPAEARFGKGTGHADWTTDDGLSSRNNKLQKEALAIMADYMAAERKCVNAIDKLDGGPQFSSADHPAKGTIPFGASASMLEEAAKHGQIKGLAPTEDDTEFMAVDFAKGAWEGGKGMVDLADLVQPFNSQNWGSNGNWNKAREGFVAFWNMSPQNEAKALVGWDELTHEPGKWAGGMAITWGVGKIVKAPLAASRAGEAAEQGAVQANRLERIKESLAALRDPAHYVHTFIAIDNKYLSVTGRASGFTDALKTHTSNLKIHLPSLPRLELRASPAGGVALAGAGRLAAHDARHPGLLQSVSERAPRAHHGSGHGSGMHDPQPDPPKKEKTKGPWPVYTRERVTADGNAFREMVARRHAPNWVKNVVDGVNFHRIHQADEVAAGRGLVHAETHVHQPLDTIRDFNNDHPREYATGTKRYNRVDIVRAVPGLREIISIKNTQIATHEKAFMGYIRELAYKYNAGTPVADVPSTPDFLRGTELEGQKILLIPFQKEGIPEGILRFAEKMNVEIRIAR